jgi:hypothetical protein
MSAVDRAIRLLVFAVIAILYFTDNITGLAAIILGVIAIVFALTSFTGFCPLYSSVKFTTLKVKK